MTANYFGSVIITGSPLIVKTDILVRSMGPICERDMVSVKVLVHGRIQIKHNHNTSQVAIGFTDPPREELDPLCPIASQGTCANLF